MAKFELTVSGSLQEVIENVDKQLKEGKNPLNFYDENQSCTDEMTVVVRIYGKFNMMLRNTTSITMMFTDKKDGTITITGISSGDEFGILGLNFGAGKNIIEICRKKISELN